MIKSTTQTEIVRKTNNLFSPLTQKLPMYVGSSVHKNQAISIWNLKYILPGVGVAGGAHGISIPQSFTVPECLSERKILVTFVVLSPWAWFLKNNVILRNQNRDQI
jgi:hypothetical protein